MTTKRLTQRRTKLEKHFTEVFSDLMAGLTQPEIAAKYGVDASAVSHFQTRNAETLNQALAETAYKTREVDIADKTYRISEYSTLYGAAKTEVTAAESTSDRLMAVRVASGALKAVAEELGQLPKSGDVNLNIDNRTQILVREVLKDG